MKQLKINKTKQETLQQYLEQYWHQEFLITEDIESNTEIKGNINLKGTIVISAEFKILDNSELHINEDSVITFKEKGKLTIVGSHLICKNVTFIFSESKNSIMVNKSFGNFEECEFKSTVSTSSPTLHIKNSRDLAFSKTKFQNIGGIKLENSHIINFNKITIRDGNGIIAKNSSNIIIENEAKFNTKGRNLILKEIEKIEIKNCEFTGFNLNENRIAGGGIYIEQAENVIISAVKIVNSIAKNGGGLQLQNITKLELNKIAISECKAKKDGGGIFIDNCKRITNKTNLSIKNCNAKQNGGGLAIRNSKIDKLEIMNCSANNGKYIYAYNATLNINKSYEKENLLFCRKSTVNNKFLNMN